MAKIEDVERRLLNWARWKIGGESGGLGYASATLGLLAGAGTSAYRESLIPTGVAEAVETDNAVKTLDLDHRRIVIEHYEHGLSLAAISVKLDCSVATVYARVDRAHRLLDQAFRVMVYSRQLEKRRVEALQEAARPKGGEF